MPFSLWNFPQRRINAKGVIGDSAAVAVEQVSSVSAHLAILHMIILFFFLLLFSVLLAIRATPLPLRRFLQLGIETDQVKGLWTSVAKDDLAALLTNLEGEREI